MAGGRAGGRAGGGFSGPRLASKPSKPAPTPAPTPAKAPASAPAPLQNGSTRGGLGSVVAEGMAFGGGSAIAHRAVDSLMGPRVIQHETVASAAPLNPIPDSCGGHFKAFQDCLDSSANDVSRCQFSMDMLTQCRKGHPGSGSSGLMA